MKFTTTDPTAGLDGSVGDSVLYVTGGAATLYYRYGSGSTDWCPTPAGGAAPAVTADPRGAGLAAPVGSVVFYVPASSGGTLLYKYGSGNTDWCTWSPVVAAHVHAQADVTGLVAALAAKAALASPTFTGTPEAPTAAASTNTTQIATTAFVASAIANLVASSPAALDTLYELAAALGNDASFAATMVAALAAKQALDATLTALAGLDGTAGLVEQTGADTFTKRALGTGAGTSVPTLADADGRYATAGHSHSGTYAAASHSHAESDITNLTTDLAAKAPTTRSISTSGQLSGGGDLSADRTLTWTDPWTWTVLAADFGTSSASPQNVDNGGGDALAFAPSASKTYVVEGMFLLQAGSSGTTAPKPGYSWPTGVSYGGAALRQPVTAGGEIFNHAIYSTAGSLTATSLPNGTAGWLCTLIATFVVGGSPSGNFQVTFQSETGGTTVTMKAGSWIRYRTIP